MGRNADNDLMLELANSVAEFQAAMLAFSKSRNESDNDAIMQALQLSEIQMYKTHNKCTEHLRANGYGEKQ